MPLTGDAKRRYQAEYMRRRRAAARTAAAEAKAAKAKAEADTIRVLPTPDLADSLAAWSQNVLKVPAGHPAAGEPMTLPPWATRFIRDAMEHRESLLCMARKNAKSAVTAIYLLGRLTGPLAVAGWRGAVASVNKAKAAELKEQVEQIALASGLHDLDFRRSPAPGRVLGPRGTLEILSADRSSGHASGFDDVVIDELGLLAERDRGLVNGLRSSTSARNGRLLHLTIWGDGPFVPELMELQDDPAVAVHLHQAPADADPSDPSTWRAANPGLGTIKSIEYMQDRARMAARNPNDASDFLAHDLNRPGAPARELIVTPAQWAELVTDDPPRREGPCVVGLDAGGSSSMTAAVVVWPATGRLEARGAFPAIPDLTERGRGDGVGRRYLQLEAAGELRTYAGRSTPVVPFLRDLADDLQGEQVLQIGADRHRLADVKDVLSDAQLRWQFVPRGMGASSIADGSADVRAFQRCVYDRSITVAAGAELMLHAVVESELRRDPAGNPAIEKARQRGRIDPLSAAVIAAGLTERWRAADRRRRNRRGVYLGSA